MNLICIIIIIIIIIIIGISVVLLELFHKLFNISIMEEGYEAIAAGLE